MPREGGHFGNSGGGSRSSGGGFRGGYHRGGYGYYGGPNIVLGHKASKIMTAIVLGIISIVFFMVFGADVNVANKRIEVIKEDYVYYKELIAKAEENPDLIKTATVTDYVYDYEKNQLKYEINACLNCPAQYTFFVYDRYETLNLLNTQIEVAVDNPVLGEHTDSIPVDFKNTVLKSDGEFLAYKNQKNTAIFVLVIICIMDVVTIFAIARDKKSKTSTEEITEETTQTTQHYKCNYCGKEFEKYTSVCTGCGANIKRVN